MNINGQIILEENFDENYLPTEEEVFEYARTIDIDPINESHLMWIAREGISAPLPKHWKPCQDPHGSIYYFNFANGDSIWDHPCDEHYKKLVESERRKAPLMKNSPAESKKIKPLDAKKKKDKAENNDLRIGTPKASYSMGTPSLHKGSPTLAPLKSGNQLAPLRGSNISNDQTIKSSLNTTGSSPKTGISQSMNVTSSMSVPVYSTEFEDEAEQANPNSKFNLNVEAQDISALKFENPANPIIVQQETESESEDYGKDVDFGIDKGLSEKIMDIENLELAVRGSLEKDFEGTLSMKSSARDEGAGKMISPLIADTSNEERLMRANLAAVAAERRANLEASKLKIEEEEEKLEAKKKQSIQGLQQKMDEELRKTEMEMRQNKERRLAEMKKEIEKEEEEEIEKLKKEKEQHIKDELDASLDKIREEISRLHQEDQSSLEKEKESLLEDLKEKVKKAVQEEEERLDNERQMQLERISADYHDELEQMKMELQEEQEDKMESVRNELMAKHEMELSELKKSQEKLHEENMKFQQREMESSKQRQRAMEDLEKGLDDVLKQRREDLRQQHQREMEETKAEYNRIIERMKEDFKEQEGIQKISLEEMLSVELKSMRKEHTKQIENLTQELATEKSITQAKLEREKNILTQKSQELNVWRTELEKISNELSLKEMALRERKQMYQMEQNEIMQEYMNIKNPQNLELKDKMKGDKAQSSSDDLMEEPYLAQQKSGFKTKNEKQGNLSMSNIHIDSSFNATPDNMKRRKSVPCLSSMTAVTRPVESQIVNGHMHPTVLPASFAQRNSITKNSASCALLEELRNNLENIIYKFDQLESCMHADRNRIHGRNKKQAMHRNFAQPVVESDNDSMGEAPLPDSHLPTADLEAEGDDEDEQSTTDDDSYNNLIKLLKNAQSNSQPKSVPQNNADGKSELYVPNGISQPDAVSDNQHLRKIIGDLCKLLENESALSAKQTPVCSNPVEAANAILQSNMHLSEFPNHATNDTSNIHLMHQRNSKLGNRLALEGPKLTPSNFSFQYVPAKDLLRDLRRISNIKPTVSAADWLPEQRNPLPRQDKTSLTNFTQLYTTDMPNLNDHLDNFPSAPLRSSTPLKRTRPPRLKLDSNNQISIQYPWSSPLHC